MADPVIDAAAPKTAAPAPATAPSSVPAAEAKPAVAAEAKPASASAPEPAAKTLAPASVSVVAPAAETAKPEPIGHASTPTPTPAVTPEVLRRLEAIEARDARAERDATLDYLLRAEMGCRLTRKQLDAVLPRDLTAKTIEGRGAIDKWARDAEQANVFVALAPRPDQIAGELSARLGATYNDNPALADRAARLTRSVFRGGR